MFHLHDQQGLRRDNAGLSERNQIEGTNELGSTTGISFVVLIVGQAKFDPALHRYKEFLHLLFAGQHRLVYYPLSFLAAFQVFPPPTTIAGASFTAATGSESVD